MWHAQCVIPREPPRSHVTQRPGASCFAISVRTLTAGSQATAILPLAAFSSEGAEEPLSAAWATGIRTSTEVSETPFNCSEMVWVGVGDTATPAARSVLVARLMAVKGVPAEACRSPVRSRPKANCAAPNVSETANTAKIPRENCDMCIGPSPHGDHQHNA